MRWLPIDNLNWIGLQVDIIGGFYEIRNRNTMHQCKHGHGGIKFIGGIAIGGQFSIQVARSKFNSHYTRINCWLRMAAGLG
jgi:hypothetical protein